jgi:hypothetical protein
VQGRVVATSSDTHLRVAMIWNGAILGEETLDVPRPVALGGAAGIFPLPDGVSAADEVVVLEPSGQGYKLCLSPSMGGYAWIDGERTRLRDVTDTGALPLGPEDYGIVTVGPIAVFFQHVRAARRPARAPFLFDGALLASLGLSIFLHTAFIVILLLARSEMPDQNAFELPPELIRRFMVTPPPEDILEPEPERRSGTDTPDPGLRSSEDMGGKKQQGDEGRVGRKNAPQERTQIAGTTTDPIGVKVRTMGLLGVLNSPQGNALDGVLDSAPNLQNLLGGLGDANTIIGRGSGGFGLRGEGGGGGGTGPGALFGAGGMGTGVGVGRGGRGRGAGGAGVPGRDRGEARVSVSTGAPRVNGYLSAEQINRVVRANQAAIRYCYENEVQRQPNLRGRIEIQWRINLQGAVTMARVDSSGMHSAGVEGCMVRQIRRWRFPEPDGGEVVVTYPFIFGVGGG